MVDAFFVAMALSDWQSLLSTPRNVDRARSCIVRHIWRMDGAQVLPTICRALKAQPI